MFSTHIHVLADPRLLPSDPHTIAQILGGLTGASLGAAIVGGLIGYAAAVWIDWLPAMAGIGAGIIGMLALVNVIPV
jgi:hypothetical protein